MDDTQNGQQNDDTDHLQSSSTFKEDPWKCVKCGAQFAQFKSWILHQQSHDHPHRKSIELIQEDIEKNEDPPPPPLPRPPQTFSPKIQIEDDLTTKLDPEPNPIIGVSAVSPVRPQEKDENVPVIKSVPKKSKTKKKARPKHRYSLSKRELRATITKIQNSKTFVKLTSRPTPKPKINNDTTTNKLNEKESSFKCALCPHRSPKISGLKIHFQKSHPPVRKFPGPLKSQNINNNRKVQSSKNNLTSTKTKNSSSMTEASAVGYERHVTRKFLKGTTVPVYVCNYCSRQFPNSSRALKHTRTHTGEQPFSCPLCGRLFSENHNMHRHLKIHNPGTKNSYKCTFPGCAKLFRDGSGLKAHWQSHESSKKVKKTSSSTSVKQQMMRQKQQQQQKNVNSNKKKKKKSAPNKSKLSSDIYKASPHIRSSAGKDGRIFYQCVFCIKEFLKPSEAVIHSRVHTGERPHKCPTCNKTFTRKNTLKLHVTRYH